MSIPSFDRVLALLTDVRPEDVGEIVRRTTLGAAASLFNAFFFFVGTYGRVDTQLALAWFVGAVALFSWIGWRSHASRGIQVKRVSRRTTRRMTTFSVLFALPWAALPLLFYGQTSANVDVIILNVCGGMAAGGAFMLHRVPAAAIGYFNAILLAVFITLFLRDLHLNWPMVFYTLAYSGFLFTMTLSAWRVSRERETTLQDLTDANAQLERLRSSAEHEALHDPLTGLANRRGLRRIVDTRVHGLKGGDDVSLLHIDLDRFKEINDTLGHAAGDHVLTHVADILRQEVRDGQFVARVGGDEFIVLCAMDLSDAALVSFAERIIAKIKRRIAYEGEFCSVGASIGIACGAIGALDLSRAMADADIALYRAKERGRGRVELYSADLRNEVEHTKRLSDDLLQALQNDEFFALFQPQIDARTGEIVGVEALARWRHATRGMLAPSVFLPIAERLGVTASIDKIVLMKGLQACGAWEAAGAYAPRLSVNVSARRLYDPDLVDQLVALGVPPGAVSFEVLESVFSDNVDDVRRAQLDRLEDLGVDLEIDDFGTGHASLMALITLGPKRLKIARELAGPVAESAMHQSLVRAIVEIAKAVRIDVTAEGVETAAQAQMLIELGCDRLQGYYFGRPMTAEDLLAALLEQAEPRLRSGGARNV